MNNEIVHFRLDSIVGNVNDLESILHQFKELIGLKIFMRFELVFSESKIVPVALITCGEYTIELLADASGTRPKGMGCIACIIFEAPNCQSGMHELEPNLKIEIRRNDDLKKAKLIGVNLISNKMKEDKDILINGCGFKMVENDLLKLLNVKFKLMQTNEKFSKEDIENAFTNDPYQQMPGWHRIGLACNNLEAATNQLINAGGTMLVAPYTVMPGLNESMIYLPSGLVIQPIVQKLWKMLPVIVAKSLISKFTSHRMRFKI